ncbi:hypothetical protein [Bacillus sp. TE8-1]|uniref:hypothetical protein n=1 Tax=Bacillus sp. TE8-1 TaxID=2217829 RepID=UPI0011EC305D|nr:hypothetical protein [Bacillus sp. TE8-1]KAA0780907.1 hypothetical protein DN404_00250 [Bacillus sp. TE8-1]
MGNITINIDNDDVQRLDIPIGTGTLTIVLGNIGIDIFSAGADPVTITLNQKLNNIIGVPTVIGSANFTTEFLIPPNINQLGKFQLIEPFISKCVPTKTDDEYICEIEKPFQSNVYLKNPFFNWIPTSFKTEWERSTETLKCIIGIYRVDDSVEPQGQASFLQYQIYIHHNN